MDTSKELSYSTTTTTTTLSTLDLSVNDYINQLTPLQIKAYEIAKDHLKTSFDITRSNGYNEWVSRIPKN